MFTPKEVSRHKNLSETVIPFWEKHVIAANVHLQLKKQQYIDKLEAFLYKCLGNGFTMKFGECIYASIHKIMLMAGVPFDITDSRKSSDMAHEVDHVMVNSQTWYQMIDANMSDIALSTESRVCSHENRRTNTLEIRSMCLDTGATEILMHDDQDVYLQDKRPANASVVGAKVDAVFDATSRGTMVMACLQQSVSRKRTLHGMLGHISGQMISNIACCRQDYLKWQL